MKTELDRKVVLVTGASGGIGKELVQKFSEEGARVAIHFHKNETSARELAHRFPACRVFHADLRNENEVATLWTEIEIELGAVEILIANSGIYPSAKVPIHEMTLQQWTTTLDANLTATFLCFREFFRGIARHHLTSPAGVIIGSTAAVFGEAFHSDYAASKAAMTYGLMSSLKNELPHIAPQGRINAICPTWTLTPMAEDFIKDPAAVIKTLQTIPLRKLVRPGDVANLAVFLSSSVVAGHISGQIMNLAGGMEGRVLYQPSEIDISKV